MHVIAADEGIYCSREVQMPEHEPMQADNPPPPSPQTHTFCKGDVGVVLGSA
jgi:hypothetical protein